MFGINYVGLTGLPGLHDDPRRQFIAAGAPDGPERYILAASLL